MAKTATSTQRLNELFDKDSRNDTSIADWLGVSKQVVSAWRKGKRSPKKSTMTKIAEKYGVDEAWLYGWDVDRPQLTFTEPATEFHPDVIKMVDDAVERAESRKQKAERRREEELNLISIFNKLTDEGRAYLLQQAEIAKKLYGGDKECQN